LLAGPHPGNTDGEELDAILNALLDAGIRSVINLTQETGVEEAEEMSDVGDAPEPLQEFAPYADRLESLAEKRGEFVEIEHLTMDVGSASADQEMEMVLDAIDAEIDGRNSPTLVHCESGNGNTGVAVGCYLARHGIAVGKAAIAKIKELRSADPALEGVKSPENIVQQRFISRWKPES
jgi:protein-tyrosine phosphatase